MQTSFSPAQLADPLTARSNKILRSCVHCGFCTATCPTYQVLGDELDSPRGRIYLIKEMLESDRPADAKTVTHIDRCLGCLSCMTTCPSGVHYAHLLEHAREHIERTYRRPPMDRLLRWVLRRILPHPGRFRLALAGARLARPIRGLMPDRRLRAMLDMAPRRIPAASRNDRGQTFPAQGTRRARVALMIGCAQRALNTDINDATIRLLQRAGVEVVIPEAFGCCGALTLHMGQEADGRARARDSIRRLLEAEAQGPLDAIIVNTSGCGTTIKDYGHLFQGDPLEPEARRVARLARDVTEFLIDLGLPPRTRTPDTLAFDTPGPTTLRPDTAAPGTSAAVLRGAALRGAGAGGAEAAAAAWADAPPGGVPPAPPASGPTSGPVSGPTSDPVSGPTSGLTSGAASGPARRGLRVAYHSACSLQHGQQVRSAPKDLLASLGYTVVEPADPHLCCGSAGTYNLLQPELSGELKSRKVATLEALAPDVIAAGNIGCMMQIGGGTGVPVVHTVELLDWATGGPKPRAMGA